MPELPSTPDVEQALRTGLAALAGEREPGGLAADRIARIDGRVAAHRRRFDLRRRVIMGAAATVVAAGGGAGVALAVARREPGSPDIATRDQGDPAGWTAVPRAPLSERYGAAMAWAGDRLVVWGGDLAGADLAGRDLGGAGAAGDGTAVSEPAHDGALFDPVDRRWAPIAPVPEPSAVGVPQFAVWTGAEVVFGPMLPSGRPATVRAARGPHQMLAYDPAGDSWRHIDAPFLDQVHLWHAVVVGGDLVVAPRFVPGARSHGAAVTAVDLASGEARPLEAGLTGRSPYPDMSGEVVLTPAGDVAVATPNWDLQPWVLDPAGPGSWRPTAAPPAAGGLHLPPAAPMGDRVAYPMSALAYDPAGDTWHELAGNPFPPARWGHEPVWTGRELLVPGAAYDPSADRWREVPAPPRGPDVQREGLGAAWTGTALLLFGGFEYRCDDDTACELSEQPPDSLDGWLLTEP
jgi:hypothetical protein